jgi:serine/threonine-protein kinase
MTIPDRLLAAFADRYRIERELGAGGMATVYLAQDLKHDRQVAIKVLRPELAAVIGAERFLSEIKTTANLQHPHILPLFDSGAADSFLFYVMPFIEGESLRDRLTREKQLPIADAVRIAGEVAGALDYAHRHNVIHRDIKPENILLHDGRALVADFGIALAASKAGGTRMTETGMSLGTPTYMSPEQAMGEREITARSDVYALGAMTYEMLLGEPPFTGPTAQSIVAKVMTEKPASLIARRDRIPPAVEDAVLTALEKLPADRFATAAQFAEALHQPGVSTMAATAARLRSATGRAAAPRERRLALAPWVALVVALASAAWGWLSRPPQPVTSWQYVTLGEGPRPASNVPSLALSPDGGSLVAKDEIQNGRLWIKRRGELTAISVPGTERGIYPAFSPDGHWVSFIADGHLKKIRPGEGAAITLADSAAAPFGGATWLDDGSIVYTGPTLSELSRVSGAGGPTASLLRTPALAGLGLAAPTPLPGSRGVLFTVCTSGCVTMSVHLLDLHTGQERLLLNDVVTAWYLPTGHLLYVRRDGAALVAPFDLKRLQITGAAVPVLERVLISTGFALLTWSPSGTLVYMQGTSVATELEVVRVTREGAAAPIDTAWHGGFNSAALSPDGRRLAVGVGLSSGTLGIWIKQLDRGPFTRLSFGGQDRRPTWSPDGQIVAFIRDSLNTSSVFARRADGSTSDRLLARLDRQVQEVTWSPDGHWLVLRTDNGAAGAGDLVGVRTSGDTVPVSLVASNFTELHPAVSPDSRWLAYTSNESGTNEIYVRPFPGTTGARWQVSTGGGTDARWSPDGRELFYLDGTSRLVAAQIRVAAAFEITGLRPLFDASGYSNPGFHQSYDVLPGGRGFLFMRPHLTGQGATTPPIVEVENWFADLRARTRK